MYLKSLTLKGFKSFAQPTTFAFEPGVTAVVGPNGSGKSNVVDALAWVMGEQGAKSLRGGKMEDVIFAGTSTKGPLGRAEVILTIDNADGALPIDYTEVTISRTLFRNGGSEYAINGDACRLLDVQELLSDSGLGREMHVIVGQGQLDSVLRATPEERRGFIEEAAGILKHRRRKEKTQRKLEAMQANLTRLNDLAGEVRRQLKPLGQQAEVAREAQGIASVVRDAKARILAADITELHKALEETAKSEADRRGERNLLQTLLAENTARLSQLEAAQVSTELDQARNLAYQFDSLSERLRSLLSIANQKVALLGSQAEVSGSQIDPAALEAEGQAAELSAAELANNVETLKRALHEAEQARSEARDVLEKFDNEVAEQNALISKFDLDKARLANDANVAESKLASLRAEVVRHEGALDEARERHAQRKSEYESLEAQLQNQQSPNDNGLEAAYEAAQKAVSESQAQIESLREELHQAERERDSLSAKRSALNLMLEQKDGATELASAGLRGIRGLVATHMKIQKGFEAAIAAALGPLADALVADTREAGLAAVEHLKSTQGGRVELIVADIDLKGAASAVANVAGARSAADVVEAPAGIISLLANIVVVDDINAAKSLYASNQDALKLTLITLDGDVLTESVIRGGSSNKPSKLELVAERDSAEVRLAEVTEAIEKSRSELTQARATEEAAKASAKDALAALKEHDQNLASNAEKLGRLRVQVEASEAEIERLSQVAKAAATGISDAESKLTESIAAHDSFAAQERPALDLANRQTLAENLEQERQRELEVRVDLGAAVERVRVEKQRSESLRAQVAEAKVAIEKSKAAAAARKAQLDSAQQVLDALPVLMDAVANSASLAKVRLHELETARANQNAELVKLRGETAEIQMKLASLTQNVHDMELANHEKRLTLANLVSRANDELGLEQAVLLEEYSPELGIPDEEAEGGTKPFIREEQQKRLRDAERLFEKLGRVNPLALEEFAALEQRHKFLTEQLADLTQTRKDLLQIIEDLDTKMQVIFADAFEDTRKAFEQVFPTLFPGGTGSIFLTNPDDMLTTGLEVTVKPAGKRIERLSLLSGGERSLAAVALMVAIFKARPSPFYVMDEVEAALDDANLGRLLQIFEDLRSNSQLIIITHQKRTMEIADALYGVSMRQDGVSAVVGQRLLDKA
ncbi:chromosome segregation protein SMC [Rhodoluna sp.]|uniref:chromosome segregation protein SMC n=1 Tax=Rhodoluna sp. TaxID=1969481 RepID=UPI0025D45D08|nr:chromosome segregation protein SMC [Rhodoluna sp.]